MINGLIIAICQLVGTYLLTPLVSLGSGRLATILNIKDGLLQLLLLAALIGVVVWAIGLVLSIVLGARYPLFGALLFAVALSVAFVAVTKFVPGIQAQLKPLIERAAAATRLTISDMNIAGVAAFIGYWINMLIRR
ncbi:MAG TPA: hypothetical protein PK264_19175 [Hyphomicrobiaceae bacterium]|nr:hypothetical protein [Hyphomicrobiaceae bacterium]